MNQLSSVVDLLTVAMETETDPRLKQAQELVLAVLFGEAYSPDPVKEVNDDDIPF